MALAIAFVLAMSKVLRGQHQSALQAEKAGLAPENSFPLRVALCTIIAITLLGAGVMLSTGNHKGVFLLAPAAITGFLFCFIEAWVLLIEIDR